MISSRNLYKKPVIKFIYPILYSFFTLTLNKHLYGIHITTATDISINWRHFCLKPWATHLDLSFKIWSSLSFFNIKYHWSVITCQFSGIAVSFWVSFSTQKSYSAWIASVYLGQSGWQIAYLSLLGLSFFLLSKIDSNILKDWTIWTCDYFIWVFANCTKLDSVSGLVELRLSWLGLLNNFFGIRVELQVIWHNKAFEKLKPAQIDERFLCY